MRADRVKLFAISLLRRKAATVHIMRDTFEAQLTPQGRAGHGMDLWVWVLP